MLIDYGGNLGVTGLDVLQFPDWNGEGDAPPDANPGDTQQIGGAAAASLNVGGTVDG